MRKYFVTVHRDPCWTIYGRNKMVLLSICSCSLICSVAAYNTCTKSQRHEAVNDFNALFLISGLTSTWLINLLLTLVHVGQALFQEKFMLRTKRMLLTDTQHFRLLEFFLGIICSVWVLSSTCHLMFTDRSLVYQCREQASCRFLVLAVVSLPYRSFTPFRNLESPVNLELYTDAQLCHGDSHNGQHRHCPL
ncbi:hypothetical protein RvY_07238-2 [Ramazzottius varieornatus]|uniref:Uncharacterized protein n=1 Tax=Ramazzottius varieornatus TaxID=947166 RepID=A0A1D1V1C5_RAMVA|nr:hypothetical protein RvY_07238-2 [Ramazzottius varieornatus]